MVAIAGLVGLRPTPESVSAVSAPPYDVIKEGTPLAARLRAEERSIVHVTLGDSPNATLKGLQDKGALITDDEPCHYVYEQRFGDERRLGVFTGVAVTDYSEKQVIRHEKTFDEKVHGRIALCEDTGHVIGPIFLLTQKNLTEALASYTQQAPLFDFKSDFGGGTDLHGVHHRVWRVPASDSLLADLLADDALYIADGHHRYHAALKGGLSHTISYITDGAKIQAYNRVIRGPIAFSEAKAKLPLEKAEAFATPNKNEFCIYTPEGCYTLKAQNVPDDVVGRLDCAILERELYPQLGLEHRHVVMHEHFDYYPESALDEMRAVVDAGKYEIAVALHPVSNDELIAVADAGLLDSEVVMPEKSTFFSPKILTGLFLMRAAKK